MILSVFTFILLGFAFTAADTSQHYAELKALHKDGYRMVTAQSDNRSNEWDLIPFSAGQLQAVKNYSGGALMPVFSSEEVRAAFLMRIGPLPQINQEPYILFGANALTNLAELSPDTGEKDARLTKVAGRLPKEPGEIAITDLTAEMFVQFGYREAGGAISQIAGQGDMVGKALGGLTVTGVFSTEIKMDLFKRWNYEDLIFMDDPYFAGISHGAAGSVINYGYVAPGFIQGATGSNAVSRLLVKSNGNTRQTAALFESISLNHADWKPYVDTLSSFYSGMLAPATGTMPWFAYTIIFDSITMVFSLIMGTIFALFAIPLTMNLMKVSLDFKQKDIGILRALGARRKDVLLICVIETLLISLINFAVSLSVVGIIAAAFNARFTIPVYHFGILQIGVMFLLAFGVAALATAIPVIRITRKKPVDIINAR